MRTDREKFLMLLLPTALVLLVYSFFILRPNASKLSSVQKQLEKVKESGVTPQQALNAKAQVNIEQKNVSKANAELDTLKSEIDSFCKSFGDSSQRFDTVDRITTLISQHNVSLITQELVEKPRISLQSSKALEKIEKKNGNQKMQYRQFSMQGGYNDMIALLKEISEKVESAFPVSIELDSRDMKGVPTWQLIVVM